MLTLMGCRQARARRQYRGHADLARDLKARLYFTDRARLQVYFAGEQTISRGRFEPRKADKY